MLAAVLVCPIPTMSFSIQLVFCCLLGISHGLLLNTRTGAAIVGNLALTGNLAVPSVSTSNLTGISSGNVTVANLTISGTITYSSGSPCCLPLVPSVASRDGSLQPVFSITFDNDTFWNGTSVATILGPYPLIAVDRSGLTTNPSYTSCVSRNGKGCVNFAYGKWGVLYTRGTVPNLPTGDSSFTIAFWIQTNSSGNNSIGTMISYGLSSGKQANAIRFASCTSLMQYYWSTNQVWTGLPNMCNNTWTHIAVVYDSIYQTVTAYVNATSYTVYAAIGGNHVAAGPLHLGEGTVPSSYAERFWGNLDDLYVYDTALNASAISTLYQS